MANLGLVSSSKEAWPFHDCRAPWSPTCCLCCDIQVTLVHVPHQQTEPVWKIIVATLWPTVNMLDLLSFLILGFLRGRALFTQLRRIMGKRIPKSPCGLEHRTQKRVQADPHVFASDTTLCKEILPLCPLNCTWLWETKTIIQASFSNKESYHLPSSMWGAWLRDVARVLCPLDRSSIMPSLTFWLCS